MKKTFLSLSVITLLFFASCSKETVWGEGPMVTETRAIVDFRGVSTAVPGQVNFTIDPVFKVEVTAQRNILQVLRTRVDNGVLEIDFPNDVRVRDHEDIVVNISGPTADYLRLSGVGDIHVSGTIVANRLDMGVSGTGTISVPQVTITDKIVANISGSGSIDVAGGSAKNEDLRISGSGNMDLSDVAAERGVIHISGSGDMKVNLSQHLDAHISGSGNVWYRGNPTIETHVSGSGTVKPL